MMGEDTNFLLKTQKRKGLKRFCRFFSSAPVSEPNNMSKNNPITPSKRFSLLLAMLLVAIF